MYIYNLAIKDFNNKILSIFASRGPIKILVIEWLGDLKTCILKHQSNTYFDMNCIKLKLIFISPSKAFKITIVKCFELKPLDEI